MAHLRAIAFYIGIYSMIVIIVLFSPLFIFTPHRWRYFYMTRWGRFAIWWLRITCRLDFRVEGREHIPRDTTCIIMANHQSAWETIVMQQLLPRHTWVLKRELLWLPFFGWGLALMFPIAIDRKGGKKALKQVIQQGIDRLKRGLWIVIFPEGTRLPPGSKHRYAIGGAMLAEKSGHPVLPVCHNAGEFWPKDNFTKRPGTITLVIGPAINPAGLRAKEINEQVEQWINTTYRRITSIEALRQSDQGKPV
ncbi:MAG: 1-acyl-sn-glycerol-3-phosphate acyltransferase [Chromatiales bacterium]|nr:1-acyl-sn-glycerol-3-phosphate acyltransferase [Gammaproteobacteria bacterium]MBW6475941.1 1-acyl-sn-glycerol-3-phosphate acyltransferase [Chromatiales bacterium]